MVIQRNICLFVVLFLITQAAIAQNIILGRMESDGIKELTTTVNVNDNPILFINSPISNLRVESKNRNIIKRVDESEGRWAVILAPGTHKIVFDAKGYEQLELENFVFVKKRSYEVHVTEASAPRVSKDIVGKGTITINTIPEGATITLDGIPGEWKTPVVLKNILAGTYNVTAVKEKFDTANFSVTIIEDIRTTVPPVKLAPNVGAVRFVTMKGVSVSIDGKRIDPATDSLVELGHGPHIIHYEKSRYQPLTDTIFIAKGDTALIQPTLVQNFAYVDISELSSGSTIILDGLQMISTTVKTVIPGDHFFTLENEKVGTLSKTLTIAPGTTRILHDANFQDPGDVLITSDVPAQLYIDNNEAALSVKQSVPAGFHKFTIVNEDLGKRTEKLWIRPGDIREAFISMRPSRGTAVFLSFIPGAKQLYIDKPLKGWFFLTTFLASAGAAGYYEYQYLQQQSAYNNYVSEYQSTKDGSYAAILHQRITARYSGMTSYNDSFKYSLCAAGGVYILSFLDALIFGPRYGYRQRDNLLTNIQMQSNNQQYAMRFYVPF